LDYRPLLNVGGKDFTESGGYFLRHLILSLRFFPHQLLSFREFGGFTDLVLRATNPHF
jgi:hypothetical protein